MGTTTYEHLIDLLLTEGDKTEEELINESLERFGFPNNMSTRGLIKIVLTIKLSTNFISERDGVYHLLKVREGERKEYIDLLKNALPQYFKERPWIKRLKTTLEEAESKK